MFFFWSTLAQLFEIRNFLGLGCSEYYLVFLTGKIVQKTEETVFVLGQAPLPLK